MAGKRRIVGLCMAAVLAAGACGQERQESIMNGFLDTPQRLSFATEDWSVRAEPDRGWVSLKIGPAEFLHAAQGRGGIVFQKGQEFITQFPDRNIIRTTGRSGGPAASGTASTC